MEDLAEKVQHNIYLGAWTNWSRGRILGATLTLDIQYGLLLLSFTATFVGFVASRFWRIVTLILHRVYSTPEPRDALHHQRQVVLRNSLSAVSTLWTSVQLAWCWRAIADGCLARILPTIIFAVSVFCAFTVAGGFTSSISSGIGNDVLIDSSSCFLWTVGDLTMETFSMIYPWVSQSMNNAANYAQQCYSFNATGTLDCTTFVKRRLEFSADFNATCPFGDGICRSNDSNLLLDSGLISTDDLGVNLPSDQRIFYREVLQCAPLRTDGFATNVSTDHNNYTRYSYGDGGWYNWTYESENIDTKYWRQLDNPTGGGTKGFNLVALRSSTANRTVLIGNSDFDPIPQLTLPDADLVLAFLSSESIAFLNQTNDPWYRAIIPFDEFYFQGDQHVLYRPDEAASPMGCALRYQYCNSNMECGSLASFTDALVDAVPLFHISPEEAWASYYGGGSVTGDNSDATALRFIQFQNTMRQSSDLYDLLGSLGPSSLLSTQHLGQGYMGPLPDNQWQLDASHWFAVRLASLQAAFVNTARGPADEALLPYMFQVDDETQRAMCKSQKILSTDYISLSLFGLYFTYVTGIIVILASYTAEPLLGLFYSRRKYGEYKYLEWATNSTLQLQRLAYQGLGSEKWTNYTDDVPKTRPGYFLADLARAYPAGNDEDEAQEVKPTVHTTLASTTTPSVSEVSTNQGVSGQPSGAPSRPSSGVPEPRIPQPVPPTRGVFAPVPQPMSPSPQAMSPSLQAVLPNPPAVSPMSESGAALGSQENHPPPNMASFVGQMQDPSPESQFRNHW